MSEEPILQVAFFRSETGREPVREWLKELAADDRKAIGEDIKLVQFRWPLGMPLVDKLDADLWEVRSRLQGGRIARVCFTVRAARWCCCTDSSRKPRRHHGKSWIWRAGVGTFGGVDKHMNQFTGSNFDDFLAEEGILDEVTARAYKRLLALQVQDAMAETQMSKSELAGRLQTSRSQLDRLLDPENTAITLDSLERLARALGKQLIVRFA
jgi:DNA-binding Xre family transcriptional regulator